MSRRNKTTGTASAQTKAAKATSADHFETLLGSSVLPSLVDIGLDAPVQLGEIVSAAHAESGLSIEAWNALPDADREQRLADAVEAMKAAVAAGAKLSTNTEGASTAGEPAGKPDGSTEGGAAEPAAKGAAAAPPKVQTPVVAGSTVSAFLNSPVRFGGKKHMPGRPVEMPAELFAELQSKGLIEEDD